MLFLALSLGACGGGATNDDIRRQQAECASGVAASCDLLNQTAPTGQQTAAATPLFTTAPSAITLASAGATYAIGGGKVPYTATSSNTGVVTTALRELVITKVPFIMSSCCTNGVVAYEDNNLGAQRRVYGDGGFDWASG